MQVSRISSAARLARNDPRAAWSEFVARASVPIRWLAMHAESTSSRRRNGQGATPRVFNLDLHISVIADLEVEFDRRGADLTRWSISGHNHVTRRVFKKPDPVRIVNQGSWWSLDDRTIDRFQDVYGRYLRTFDGFVACFTPAFAELFRGMGKPTLVVSATRYEAPYTQQAAQWKRLNRYIQDEVNADRMILVANNRGDRDYMSFHLGLTPLYVPSVCDYTGARWRGSGGPRLIQSRTKQLNERLTQISGGIWRDSQTVLPRRHSWEDVIASEEIFVVPYNISTMTLFELATAGVPVSIPSRQFLKELRRADKGILGELTWFQVLDAEPPQDFRDPSCEANPGFIDWWLDRADFYDSSLMPNVRVVDSLEELLTPHPVLEERVDSWQGRVDARNDALRRRRSELFDEFFQLM